MSDRALTLARADSVQVPAIVVDVGPEATQIFLFGERAREPAEETLAGQTLLLPLIRDVVKKGSDSEIFSL
jgi:hypothetical protein